jgi:hypothetical protein
MARQPIWRGETSGNPIRFVRQEELIKYAPLVFASFLDRKKQKQWENSSQEGHQPAWCFACLGPTPAERRRPSLVAVKASL